MAGQGPGIDPLDPDDSILGEITGQVLLRPKVGSDPAQFLDDKTFQKYFPGFDILAVHPVVADQGIGHRDDLALIGGVGQDFLVTHHAGVEHHFAEPLSGGSKPVAGINRPVFQDQLGDFFFHRLTPKPRPNLVKMVSIFNPRVMVCPSNPGGTTSFRKKNRGVS